jgi:hypothetical protein
MSTFIPDANGLVAFVESFTGSSNDQEIKDCIYLAELSMRNIELPALRTNPWTTTGTADQWGAVPIPSDMNRPILFFNQGPQSSSSTGAGPWIVYDRIGDRDMITEQLVQNLYLNPVNISEVYRGQFSEVGQKYEFTPALTQGTVINLYYFTTWPLLFTVESDGVTQVLNNVVLQSWPEGYIYGTLREYYLKRKMPEDAAVWDKKFQEAWNIVEDQNNKGKWSGGHNKLTSVFQPRRNQRYSTR